MSKTRGASIQGEMVFAHIGETIWHSHYQCVIFSLPLPLVNKSLAAFVKQHGIIMTFEECTIWLFVP